MTQTIEIQLKDASGVFPAYLADPAKPATAGIIVIQEAFGLNAGIRRRCDLLAEVGYLAIAPDLYWRTQPGIALDPDIKPQADRGMKLLGDFDSDRAVGDIQAAIATARRRLPSGSKVGALGYCIGGKLAYMTAAQTDVDASVGYYGIGIDTLLDQMGAIANPFMLHVGKDDQYFHPAAQERIRVAFEIDPKLSMYKYDSAGHGFATEFGARRVEQAAVIADGRTADFFDRHLRQIGCSSSIPTSSEVGDGLSRRREISDE
jgi:carboxymethylenebutenolidase